MKYDVYIGKANSEDNKKIYDYLYSNKKEIETAFEDSLSWYELEGKAACRIAYKKSDANVFNEEEWDSIIEFLANNIKKLKCALENHLKQAVKTIN